MTDTPTQPRGLGFMMTLALVIGNLIGSGIYLLPATLAPLGDNQLYGWMITITGAMAMGVVFARLAAALPVAGGPYAYVQAAFGPFVGFIAAWSYWTLLWAGNGAIAVAVVSNISLLVPAINTTPGMPAILSVASVWLLTAVNIRGVREAGYVSLVTVALKLIPLAALIGLAFWLALSGAPHAVQPAVPVTAGTIAGAAGLTFWAFLGIESATVPADRIERAARVVPRATLIGAGVTGLIYLGISLAFESYISSSRAAISPAPIAMFLGNWWGDGVARAVAVFAAISAFGTLNGFILLQGEMPFAMARGGVFPRWFAAETRWGTPARAHIVSSLLLSVVTLLNFGRGTGDLFQFIASVSLGAGMLSYFLAMIAAVRLLPRERPLACVALFAAAFTAWASWGLGAQALGYGAVFLALGVPVYFVIRRARRISGPDAEPSTGSTGHG